MKIYMNHIPWDIGHSTDRRMRLVFKTLGDKYDLDFYYPHAWSASVKPVLSHLFNAVRRRLPLFAGKQKLGFEITHDRIVSEKEFESRHFDVVYSQGVIPVSSKKGVPLLCDLSFIDPENTDAYVTEQSIARWEKLVSDMREVATKRCIINLRSDYSLKLVHELIPGYEHKFVNLPFLLPTLKALPQGEVIGKHTGVGVFKIAFIGAQARRKGIDLLLKALGILCNERGVRNVELHIVSGFTDGQVDIPGNLPVVNHGARDYQYAMDVLKSSHIYVMPSYFESFGLSYVEALANGCVVLARNFEPQREIVDYGKAGFVVNLDAKDIADKILRVLNMDEAERKQVALNGLRRFLVKYEYSVVAERWYEAFRKCALID